MKKKILVIGIILAIIAAAVGIIAQRPEVREQF